jgi:hypothetical protein
MLEQTHKVTFGGVYGVDGGGNNSYEITVDIPHEVVKNQNVIGWFKNEMRNTKSEVYKAFVKDHSDFDKLGTHHIKNLEEVETIKHGD